MLIASRLLRLRSQKGDVDIPIRIFAPEEDQGAWKCRYEIDWPEGTRTSGAVGFDSVQAIVLTFQKIGSEIYGSGYHKSGDLMWEKPGNGYGFPVPHNARDWLEGDDAVFF